MRRGVCQVGIGRGPVSSALQGVDLVQRSTRAGLCQAPHTPCLCQVGVGGVCGVQDGHVANLVLDHVAPTQYAHLETLKRLPNIVPIPLARHLPSIPNPKDSKIETRIPKLQ